MKWTYRIAFTQTGAWEIDPRKLCIVFAGKRSVPLVYFVFLWYEVTSCNTYGLWGPCIYFVIFDSTPIPVHTYHFSQTTSSGGNTEPVVGAVDVYIYLHSFYGRVSFQTRSKKALHILSKSFFISRHPHCGFRISQYHFCWKKWNVQSAFVRIHV